MKKIGIFGGTFNPIHKGHMHLADTVSDTIGLDKLIFMPSNIPPHKSADNLYANEIRFEMCKLAAESDKRYEVSDFEIKRQGKSYSVYTVEHIRKLYPDDIIYMLLGSDMLLSFDKWFRFEEILKNVALAVVSRENDDIDALKRKSCELRKYGQIELLSAEPFPISSTEIRNKIKNSEKYSCYLPEKVVQYIRLNNLYR